MLYSLIDFIKYNSRNNQEIANEYEGSENRFSSEKLATIAFKLTEINYECKYKYTDANNIFDVLGFFSTSEPKRISMCHELIRDHAIAMSLPYPILFHIIAVHEYAHMIHFYFNKGNQMINIV